MRKILTLPLGETNPADARHVGDGIALGRALMISKPFVHDAVESVNLVGKKGRSQKQPVSARNRDCREPRRELLSLRNIERTHHIG